MNQTFQSEHKFLIPRTGTKEYLSLCLRALTTICIFFIFRQFEFGMFYLVNLRCQTLLTSSRLSRSAESWSNTTTAQMSVATACGIQETDQTHTEMSKKASKNWPSLKSFTYFCTQNRNAVL